MNYEYEEEIVDDPYIWFSADEEEDDHCDCSRCMDCLGLTERDF